MLCIYMYIYILYIYIIYIYLFIVVWRVQRNYGWAVGWLCVEYLCACICISSATHPPKPTRTHAPKKHAFDPQTAHPTPANGQI